MSIDRAALWSWLAAAPLPVVLSLCVGTTGALGMYVSGEVGDQKAKVAVAEAAAHTASTQAVAVEARLTRLEEKLDRLLEAVAALTAEAERRPPSPESPRPRSVVKEKNR